MAWIESHQSLLRHPKTAMAVGMLQCDRYKFIGHLMALWWWGLDVADYEGTLPTNTSDAALADAAGWPLESASEFVRVLRRTGFIEKKGFRLHDWWEYAGKYNAKRAANKERMRDARAVNVQRTERNRATHVQGLPTYLPILPTNQPTYPPTAAEVLAARPNIFVLFEKLFRKPITPLAADKLRDYEKSNSQECIAHCFVEAEERGARTPSYLYSILDRHAAEGCVDDRPRLSTPEAADSGVSAEHERLGLGQPARMVANPFVQRDANGRALKAVDAGGVGNG